MNAEVVVEHLHFGAKRLLSGVGGWYRIGRLCPSKIGMSRSFVLAHGPN